MIQGSPFSSSILSISSLSPSPREWSADNDLNSLVLFPSEDGADGHLSGSAVRGIRGTLESGPDVKFGLRMCRRTFGQRYPDNDVDIRLFLGHASTKTAEDSTAGRGSTRPWTTQGTHGCPVVDSDPVHFLMIWVVGSGGQGEIRTRGLIVANDAI